MIAFEYHHFATAKESIYKTTEKHQQLLIEKREKTRHCVPPEERTQDHL